MHVFYLHGFASSARSSKAQFFGARLAGHGLRLHVPDLNEPDVSTLTATRMISQVEAALAALPPAPVTLIGSSLGGFVAWHVAARAEARGAPDMRLVLLAPAFDFGTRRMSLLSGEELARWEATGWHRFHHYAYDEPRAIHYALHADAQQYDSRAVPVTSRGLVFMGRHDQVVDPAMVAAFCAARPNLRLVWLEDDHQLAASLDAIWTATAAWLDLPADR